MYLPQGEGPDLQLGPIARAFFLGVSLFPGILCGTWVSFGCLFPVVIPKRRVFKGNHTNVSSVP